MLNLQELLEDHKAQNPKHTRFSANRNAEGCDIKKQPIPDIIIIGYVSV